MKHWLERTWAEIDLDALSANFQAVRSALRPDCRVMAVVKADAYGHGAQLTAKAFSDAGADWLAVSNLDEALQLRKAGITLPLLILSYTPPEETETLVRHGITQTVISLPHAKALSEAAVRAGVTLPVHLKLDTGMSRVGFFCQSPGDAAADEITSVCRLPGLRADGVFTHFAVADECTEESDAFTRAQYARFTGMLSELQARGIAFPLCHCCNSAATLRFPEMHMDMVRPGIILYGLYPEPSLRKLLPLRPVMSLRTRVSQVKTVPEGSFVSYGRAFTASRGTDLATVPIGYADGYTRRVEDGAYMLVHGKRAPIRGRVCMDQCMLDVTGISDVESGSIATAFGQSGESFLPVEIVAAWSGTIHYELVCAVGKRVPRLYMQGGKSVFVQNDLI